VTSQVFLLMCNIPSHLCCVSTRTHSTGEESSRCCRLLLWVEKCLCHIWDSLETPLVTLRQWWTMTRTHLEVDDGFHLQWDISQDRWSQFREPSETFAAEF